MNFEIGLAKGTIQKLKTKYAKLGLSATGLMGDVLRDEMNDKVYRPSQRLVPFKEGDLQASGAIDDPVISGDSVMVLVHYDEPYARRLHEEQYANYSKKGTGSKYLETPFKEWASRAKISLARKIAKEIKIKTGVPLE